MSDKTMNDIKQGPIPFSLRLRSIKSSRQTLARLIREWGRGNITEADAKTATYLLNILLGYHRAGLEESVELQLADLKKRITKLEKEKSDD